MKKKQSLISVLVVEDVDEMRSLLELIFKGMEGIGLSGVAKNGFEARLILSRNRPDLVVLDEVLPGESSYDLLKEIESQGIPVVLMTSLENPPSHLPPGASARMTKPGWSSIDQDRSRIQSILLKFGNPKS